MKTLIKQEPEPEPEQIWINYVPVAPCNTYIHIMHILQLPLAPYTRYYKDIVTAYGALHYLYT